MEAKKTAEEIKKERLRLLNEAKKEKNKRKTKRKIRDLKKLEELDEKRKEKKINEVASKTGIPSAIIEEMMGKE